MSVLVFSLALLPGCVVIPLGDLLKGPSLQEQVLREGAGFFEKEKIAVVDVSGVIRGHEDTNLLRSAPDSVSEIKAQLDWASRDPEVKAVVLKIASAGGEVTACDIVHEQVRRVREKRRLPVVACIVDQGASGGYYIACAADSIIAHPTAVVGSIGVIVQNFDLSGLLEKIGVHVEPVKSSDMKDLMSIFRPRTREETEVLSRLVDDMYGRFIDVVDSGRSDLSRDEVVKLADGGIVSGVRAAELKLVDRTGYLEDAVEEAGKRAGVTSPTVVRYTRKARSGSNIYTRLGVSAGADHRTLPGVLEFDVRWNPEAFTVPRLYYLWQP